MFPRGMLEVRISCRLSFQANSSVILEDVGETGASCNKNNIFQDCGRVL